jgi:hypothetical protein
MVDASHTILSKLKQSELGSSTLIYPTIGRLNIVGMNSPLGLLSTNGICEPTQTPLRSPKCNLEEVNSPLKI